MSGRKAWKADKRALKQLTATNKRQRMNMRAYIAIIYNTKKALIDGDLVRALALVSGNIKYPPDLLKEEDDAKTK